jgi:hypothetical protein
VRHLLVIGAQRCGTTYLATVLDAHPEIAMARPSRPEPKVFLDRDRWRRGLQWYRGTYFDAALADRPAAQLLAEKSTSYLEHASAAAAAAEVLGSAEIVVLLRDPVERAISNWRFSAANGLEDRPLERALRENLVRARPWDPQTTSVSPYAYLERGRYVEYLRPWLERFPTTLHSRFTEELVGCPDALGDLYGALGVNPSFRPTGLDERVNAAGGIAPKLDEELQAEVRAYFSDSDAKLRELLGRPLPWGSRD